MKWSAGPSNPDKDSFAIAVSTRSGKCIEMQNRFGNDGVNLKNMLEIAQLLREDALSKSSIYTLIFILSEMFVKNTKIENGIVEALIARSICTFGNPTMIDEQNSGKLIALYHQYDGIYLVSFLPWKLLFLGKGGVSCIIE